MIPSARFETSTMPQKSAGLRVSRRLGVADQRVACVVHYNIDSAVF